MLSMKSTAPTLPDEVAAQIRTLGVRIRAARILRGMRQEDLATKSGLSRTAIEAVERGAPTTGLGTYLRALWAMGLNQELDLLADPGLDRDGMALQFNVQSKRVGVARKPRNDF
jgi:transcriptional regulator with XRE-family HTH domain